MGISNTNEAKQKIHVDLHLEALEAHSETPWTFFVPYCV